MTGDPGRGRALTRALDMPRMSGLDLCAMARRDHPEVVRILLTGRATVEAAPRAINEGGVFRYLTKSWKDPELRVTLREVVAGLVEMRRAGGRRARRE